MASALRPRAASLLLGSLRPAMLSPHLCGYRLSALGPNGFNGATPEGSGPSAAGGETFRVPPMPAFQGQQPQESHQPHQQPQQQHFSPPTPQQQQPYTPPQPVQQQNYQQPPYQQQYFQQQPPYYPPPPQQQQQQQYHGYSTQVMPGPYPPPQQQQYGAGGYQQRFGSAPYTTAAGAAASKELQRVNTGEKTVNRVVLQGTIANPQQQGRSALATINVSNATKAGIHSFTVEAWDEDAPQLMQLHGVTVLVEGRLRLDKSGAVRVVPSSIKVVDDSLPVTPVKKSKIGTPTSAAKPRAPKDAPEGASPRQKVDPAVAWKTHYETQTQTFQDLATHFKVAVKTVQDRLLEHAFQTRSPLRYRPLAQEIGLDVEPGGPTLQDLIVVVSEYKQQFGAAQAGAQPGAAPPEAPKTKTGMLRVKPIRDWALGEPYGPVIQQYQAKFGEAKVYDALRLAVVAESTLGAWDPIVEFSS